eukprot:SAG11_NODE_35321_length_267_cov_0.613095_1_plen_42_part_01
MRAVSERARKRADYCQYNTNALLLLLKLLSFKSYSCAGSSVM